MAPTLVWLKFLCPPQGEGPTAALLHQIFEVDPLDCPSCHGAMRLVACITQPSVIGQSLTHLQARWSRAAHAGPPSPHRREPPRAEARHTEARHTEARKRGASRALAPARRHRDLLAGAREPRERGPYSAHPD